MKIYTYSETLISLVDLIKFLIFYYQQVSVDYRYTNIYEQTSLLGSYSINSHSDNIREH